MPINNELVARCLTPISADAPAGADLRYDTRLDVIKEARREDDLPGADRKMADWGAVITSSSALLEQETKDLQLAAWLTEALMRSQGFAGLLTGVEITRGLLEHFWDTVYPLPEDGDLELRLGVLEWIGSRLTVPLRLTPFLGRFSCADLDAVRNVPTDSDARQDTDARQARDAAEAEARLLPEDLEADRAALSKVAIRTLLADIATTITALEQMEALADEKFGRDAPSFGPLRNALEEPRRVLQQTLSAKLELDPDPVDEISAEEDGAASGTSDPDAPQTPEPTSAADAALRVAVSARWMRQRQSANPAPYLTLRGLRWGELMANAPEVEPRLLEPPPTAVRIRLRGLLIDEKWSELLEQGEALMATPAGRGWLDLQRYALLALANLGAEYDGVAAGIRQQLRALLGAVPRLPWMTLMDDTPTANEETRAWIEETILDEPPAEHVATDAPDTAPSDGSDLLHDALEADAATAQLGGLAKARSVHPSSARTGRDAFTLARADLEQNRPQRAIERLMAELTRDPSPRSRFLRQTQMAYIMVEAGLHAVAQPILERLVQDIDERNLEQWESGPLIAQPMALLHRLLDRADADDSRRGELYLRVCRLDPIQALALRAP